MWIGSSEPPSWWPAGFPDIYVTDTPQTIQAKLDASVLGKPEQDVGDARPPQLKKPKEGSDEV